MNLTPAIVRDANSGAVLTLAYMSEESLQKTIESGETWFWSRSRNELWHKGATSGNTQRVVHIARDCDRDALLISVIPNGPACHQGTESCFEDVPPLPLRRLEQTLRDRFEKRPTGSYTATLFDAGRAKIAQKVGEEATEVVVAALAGEGRERVVSEAADLLYHLMVLLTNEGISMREVEEELELRSRGPAARTE